MIGEVFIEKLGMHILARKVEYEESYSQALLLEIIQAIMLVLQMCKHFLYYSYLFFAYCTVYSRVECGIFF